MYYYIAIGIIVLGIVWTVGSYLVMCTIEELSYTVVAKKDGYEIRSYAPYIKAEVRVTGSYDEATSQGFRIIADYIFGNNTTQARIAMTTPVLEETKTPQSEKIAMTTPVLEVAGDSDTHTIAFVLPSSYTLETLPTPNNPAISLVPMSARTVAALRFTWYPSAVRVTHKKELLRSYLERDGLLISGTIETARYNPPLSMPLILRNEILIPVSM